MASAATRKFVTTICFCQEIGRCIYKNAMASDGRQWLKKKSRGLMDTADMYRQRYNEDMGPKDIARVQDGLDAMVGAGLESCHSYQSYLSFLIPILNERRMELESARKCDHGKVSALNDMIHRAEEINQYYEQRIRHTKFEMEGCALLDSFNSMEV